MAYVFQNQSVPTIYFIGVTTARSSIMRVFPGWAAELGLKAHIVGVDFALHDRPEAYRSIVAHIAGDPHSMGALVTTHKLDLLQATRDLFGRLGRYATELKEISCISKQDGLLVGNAMDPLTSGLALDAFLARVGRRDTPREILLLGAGGSSLALTVNLLERAAWGRPSPARIVVSNRSQGRLDAMRAIHASIPTTIQLEYALAPSPEHNDRLLAGMAPHSLVINATGLGKDRPGSPLTDQAVFPAEALVWDFNYRGDLRFLDQARCQQMARSLTLEDGWVYFLHGWTRVISEVFHIDIPTAGPRFDALSESARKARA